MTIQKVCLTRRNGLFAWSTEERSKQQSYFKGKKGQVPDKNIFHQTNNKSIKLMVLTCFACSGVTKWLWSESKCTYIQTTFTERTFTYCLTHLYTQNLDFCSRKCTNNPSKSCTRFFTRALTSCFIKKQKRIERANQNCTEKYCL